MRKDEVEFHSDGFRGARPAVNVKVDFYLYDRKVSKLVEDVRAGYLGNDQRFSIEWLEEHETEVEWTFEAACMDGWDQLQEEAEGIFGSVKVYSEGRSAGWAVVDGLPEFEDWDAIDLGRWARFAKIARQLADDVPYQMVSLAAINTFEAWADDQAKLMTGPSMEAVI